MKSTKLLATLSLTLIAGLSMVGCARPNEIGWTPAYTVQERGNQIARNWDYEGKQMQDDIDDILMMRPVAGLTVWNVR